MADFFENPLESLFRPVVEATNVSLSRSMGGGVSIAALTTALAADPGVTDFAIYDPSDKTSMFTTDTGTTQVASDGDTVGLWLDKSQMGGQTAAAFIDGQAELNSGEIDTAANWVAFGNNTVVDDDGAVKITYVDDNNGAQITLSASGTLTETPVDGDWCYFSAQVKVSTGSVAFSCLGGNVNPNQSVTSTNYVTIIGFFQSDGTDQVIRTPGMSAGEAIWIKGFTCKKIPGHHFSQATAASRPVWHDTSGAAPYWVEGDGVDDWLPGNPLFDLGETWAHVGAWRVDAGSDALFALSNVSAKSGPISQATAANGLDWRNSADSGLSEVLAGDPTSAFVMTLDEASNSIDSRYNGAADTTLAVYDDSAGTQGLALFSVVNSAGTTPLDGRLYFALFVEGSMSAATRALAEQVAEASTGETLL